MSDIRAAALKVAFTETVSRLGGGPGRSDAALEAATYTAAVAALGLACGHNKSQINPTVIADAKQRIIDALDVAWPEALEDAGHG